MQVGIALPKQDGENREKKNHKPCDGFHAEAAGNFVFRFKGPVGKIVQLHLIEQPNGQIDVG